MRIFCICLCLLLVRVNANGEASESSSTDPTSKAPLPPPEQLIDSGTLHIIRHSVPTEDDLVNINDNTLVPCAVVTPANKDVILGDLVTPGRNQIEIACRDNKAETKVDSFIYVKFVKDTVDYKEKTHKVNTDKWYCCIEKTTICGNGDVETESATFGAVVKECEHSYDCSPGKTCHSGNDNKNKIQRDYLKNHLGFNVGPVCCPYFEDPAQNVGKSNKCKKGTALQPRAFENNAEACKQDGRFGRCNSQIAGNKEVGICAQVDYAPQFEATCCTPPDEDLCPGGLLPVPFPIIENETLRNTFTSSFDYHYPEDAGMKVFFSERCRDLKDTYEFPSEGEAKLCCPKGKPTGNHYYQNALHQVMLSQKEPTNGKCDADELPAEAIEAVQSTLGTAPAPGKKKMCFKVPECNSTTTKHFAVFGTNEDFNCEMDKSNTCNGKGVCVYHDATLAICCAQAAYNDKCTAEASGIPGITSQGKVVDLSEADCKSSPQSQLARKTLKFGDVKICCEYTTTTGTNTGTGAPPSPVCKNNGDFFLHPATGNPIPCANTSTDGEQCNSRRGNCRKAGTSGFFCCEENRCPSDGVTTMDHLPGCDSSECAWKGKGEAFNTVFCQADKAGKKHCCPYKQTPGQKASDVAASLQMTATNTGQKCNDMDDCAPGLICRPEKAEIRSDPKTCWTYGKETQVDPKSQCNKNAECENLGKRQWYCVRDNGKGRPGSCTTEQEVKDPGSKEVPPALKFAAAGCGVGAAVFGLLAVIFFLKYRSKNFCDQRKPSKKNKKKKKEEKTEGTTGGETTGGGESTMGK